MLRILMVIAILAGGAAFFGAMKLQGKRKAAEDDAAVKAQTIVTVTGERDKEKMAKETAESERDEKGKKLDMANQDIKQKDGEISTHKSKIGELENKVTQTTSELTESQAQMKRIQDVLPPGIPAEQIGEEIKKLNDSFATLDAEKQVLGKELQKKQDEIKRLEDQARMSREGVMAPGLTGRIVAVNADWNFVVIDIGSKQGVVPNVPMMVHRDGRLIGKVKITTTDAIVSVADVMPEWKQEEILLGDMVSY